MGSVDFFITAHRSAGSVEFKFRYETKLDKQEMPGTFLLVVIA